MVGITAASGAIFGVRLLELLASKGEIETHLVISKNSALTLQAETGLTIKDVEQKADYSYPAGNVGAAIASGSFRTSGMIIAPCSIKTAAAIAHGFSDDLVARAADVILKERRSLVLAIRETPLHAGHLETLLKLARLGAVIFPPVPSFYHRPRDLSDIVDQSVMRMLDQFEIDVDAAPRWGEAGGIPAVGNER